MRFSVLASSSSANATFVEAGGVRLLIDAGLRCKPLEERLQAIGVAPNSLDGILITHEHTDHIQGVARFVKKYPMPVFANENTAEVIARICQQNAQPVPEFGFFESNFSFNFGDLTITPQQIPHDTAEPVGYLLSDGEHTLGYFTDLGFVPAHVSNAIPHCDALILESNYDPQMLRTSNRPFSLISRISGRSGHLSNEQACETIATYASERLKSLTLAHLSTECNDPNLVQALMKATLKTIQRTDIALTIARPDAATPIEVL